MPRARSPASSSSRSRAKASWTSSTSRSVASEPSSGSRRSRVSVSSASSRSRCSLRLGGRCARLDRRRSAPRPSSTSSRSRGLARVRRSLASRRASRAQLALEPLALGAPSRTVSCGLDCSARAAPVGSSRSALARSERSLELLARALELLPQPLAAPRAPVPGAHAPRRARLDALDPRARLGQLGAHGPSALDRLAARSPPAQPRASPCAPGPRRPIRPPALVREGGLQRVDLGACLLDLLAQPLLGLGRAGQVAAHAVHGGAHGLQLAAQALALGLACSASRRSRSPSSRAWLSPVARLCSSPSRRPSTCARISSSARRASASPDSRPAPACSSSISRALASAASVRAPSASARASASSAAVCSSARSMSSERTSAASTASAISPPRGRWRVRRARLAGQRRRRRADRPEGHDRAGAQPVLLQVRLPLDGRRGSTRRPCGGSAAAGPGRCRAARRSRAPRGSR